MNIITAWESTPALWSAIDADSYDGATDSKGHPRGLGKTEREAINELVEELLERERRACAVRPREETMNDSERLDWIESHPGTAHGHVGFDHPDAGKMGLWYEDYSRSPSVPGFVTADSLREAIDKAAVRQPLPELPHQGGG